MAPPQHLKPERLEIAPTDANAQKRFTHWLRTFTTYVDLMDNGTNKLDVLINFIGADPYAIIETSATYAAAIADLKAAYQKEINQIYARHILATRKQNPEESLDDYLRNLRILAKDCNFQQVTAAVYTQEAIRDAFIAGLKSSYIRQRLLENNTLDLDTAFTTARALDVAQRSSDTYTKTIPTCAATNVKPQNRPPPEPGPTVPQIAAAARFNRPQQYRYSRNTRSQPNRFPPPNKSPPSDCYFCGYDYHPRFECPAKDSFCAKCGRKGHYAKVCRSNPNPDKVTAATYVTESPPKHNEPDVQNSWPPMWAITPAITPLCTITGQPPLHPLSQSMTDVEINKQSVQGVADSASSYSFIHPNCAKSLGLIMTPTNNKPKISMASKSLTAEVQGYCEIQLKVKDRTYDNFKLFILPNLCTNLILGLDFLSLHESITMKYGGSQPPLTVCGLSTLKVEPPALFSNLTPNCRPIADKSRNYSQEDREFIDGEVRRLLKEDIIESSNSPWRAQVVVVRKGEKKRLAIDYSQTINLFTQLDAYPLPRICDIINQIAKYYVHTTVDMTSAYHQLKIKACDKPYTAFQASNRLYQFKRLPFGVTNGVSVFQREMDRMVDKYSLEGTFPYLDNITISGKTQEEHDTNVDRFFSAAKEMNLTYNESKCEFNTRKLSLLGCVVENGEIRPDPERMKPLEALPPPYDTKSLKRCLGFFSYYAKWIPNFSEKVRPLTKTSTFPISSEALKAMNSMKDDIRNSVVCCIDESIPFTVETDASEYAIAATLNQRGRPVAFFSRTLQPHELVNPSIEKEAMAIIEAIRTWRHFLACHKFTLVTDQRSIAFMFNTQQKTKIKNDKILRWRIELSTYNYDIQYRPGSLNEAPDALSRICASSSLALSRICASPLNLQTIHPETVSRICASSSGLDLYTIHEDLCHPGITRMLHFVKSRNLPFSVEDVRAARRSCQTCAECKPEFYRSPQPATLIRSTRPFERLNVDFKGPLPSTNRNRFFLNVVDEYSRFPWVFPCSDISASTVSCCFVTLFTMFGLPEYIHSDQGSSFLSRELRDFLSSRGIASSNTTAYNPRGNGQVERENGTVWRTITLALKTKGLPVSRWQEVLPDALHSIRSLLCTATNATPHERLFSFPRKSTAGVSLPTWLTKPGPVLVKVHARAHKTDPLVEDAELIHANPNYAFIKFPDGREKSVSLRDLAPAADASLRDPPPTADASLRDSSPTTDVIAPPTTEVTTPPAPEPPTAVQPEVHETTITKVPLMGRSGEKWCELNPANVVRGSRRRKD